MFGYVVLFLQDFNKKNEMEAVSKKTAFYRRKMGNYEITWKIENFCFALLANKSICILPSAWTVQTPFFYLNGRLSTRWKFILSILPGIQDSCSVQLCIEREKSEFGPDFIFSEWQVVAATFTENNERKQLSIENFECVFGKGTSYKCKEIYVAGLLNNFNPFGKNVFEIKFKLLFNDQYSPTSELQETSCSVPSAFLSLSNCMKNLLESGEHSDLVLIGDGNAVRVHKAVIYNRCFNLGSIIEDNRKSSFIDLSRKCNGEALESVVNYLYTGNFEEVIREPTFAKQQLVNFLDIQEIKNWFVLDKMCIWSKYSVSEYTKNWKIKNYSSKMSEAIVMSKVLKVLESQLKLCFYPNTSDETEDYVSLTIHSDCDIKEILYIQFSVTKVGGYMCLNTKSLICPKGVREIGFKQFAKKDFILDNLIDDTLCIKIKLKHCAGSKWDTTTDYVNDNHSRIEVDYYKKLSLDLTRMYDYGQFADISVKLGCENEIFKLHKCILGTRAEVLTRHFNRINTLLQNTRKSVLHSLFLYVYGGVVEFNNDVSETFDVLELAIVYKIYELKGICIKFLRKQIDVKTVTQILTNAHYYQVQSLKDSALEFISHNFDAVSNESSWKTLINSEGLLIKQVRKYMEKQSCSTRKKILAALEIE